MRRILIALPLLAAGCMTPEPFDREGTWRASGANQANLRAMVADPSHLDRGVAPATPARGEAAARGINRGAGANPPRLPAGGTSTSNRGGGDPALPAPTGNNVGR
jgi:hypothetical protein